MNRFDIYNIFVSESIIQSVSETQYIIDGYFVNEPSVLFTEVLENNINHILGPHLTV
jgi:hypothetical protein